MSNGGNLKAEYVASLVKLHSKELIARISRDNLILQQLTNMSISGIALQNRRSSKIQIIADSGIQHTATDFPEVPLDKSIAIDYIVENSMFKQNDLLTKHEVKSIISIPLPLRTFDYSNVIVFAMDEHPLYPKANDINVLKAFATNIQDLFNTEYLCNSDQNKSLLIFNARLAHILKRPLSNILLGTQLFSKKTNTTETRKVHADLVITSTLRCKLKIESLVVLSEHQKYTGLNREVFRSEQLFRKLSSTFSSSYRRIEYSFENLEIKSDQRALNLCLSELIQNAIKFSKTQSAIEVKAYKINNHIRFKVSGKSQSIHKDFSSRIFHPFESTLPSTIDKIRGIGLTKVRIIVENLQGIVWFESSREGLTSFYIDL